MKMKKYFVKIALFLLGVLMVLTPFGIFHLVALNQTHVFSKTYYAALVDKTNNLKSLKNEKKIVLIGGSNVAFGFNSELLDNEFSDYKVVNYGLYAMLGTKIMLDLALDYINSGDMVFIIPEINSQSTSLYFNPEATLKALEDDMGLVKKLPRDDRYKVYSEYFDFVSNRGKYKEKIEPTGVYQRKNFNEYGDIEYLGKNDDDEVISLRTQNQMKSKRFIDPVVSFNTEDISTDFIDYLNKYSKKIKNKGASLYYEFSPVNNLALQGSEQTVTDYYWYLRENLDFDVVGNPLDYLIDPHYFYDSNFHLNDNGAVLRTHTFISDIYRDIYKESKVPSFELPEMPDYPYVEKLDEDNDPICEYCEFVELDSGYYLSKFNNTDGLEDITLPMVYDHRYVTGISKHAFENSGLETITVPSSYTYFENEAFDNCPTLTKVYLAQEDPSLLSIDFTGGLLKNVPKSFKFYVPSSSYQSYLTDYNWQFYKRYLGVY